MHSLTRNRKAPKVGIVHLGPGAFFRAHVAQYTERAITNSVGQWIESDLAEGDWGIIGVSLHSSKVRDDLSAQQYAYTALQLNTDQPSASQVEVINTILVAPENPAAVLKQMANPEIKIVTLTVTEKGYCAEALTGALDTDHADIVHELSNNLPVSAPGFLVRALETRWKAGHLPFTVLSCDNLPGNGRVIKRVVLELAKHINRDLASWIEEHGRFPSTMVDRITPATTNEDREKVKKKTGFYDASPVVHEPFSQWVIEDDFVSAEKPDWASAGAELVKDVRPFELMKLRMLNATHSALAYLGYLAGFESISDTVADDDYCAFTFLLWHNEIIPSLHAPPGVSMSDYATSLMSRYANANVRHLTWQIAMDGSQKIPQRIIGTLEHNLTHDIDSPGLILTIAAWMRYVSGIDETGNTIDVRDPLAEKFISMRQPESAPEQWVTRLLAMTEIFPAHVADQLSVPLTQTYLELVEHGAHAMVKKIS